MNLEQFKKAISGTKFEADFLIQLNVNEGQMPMAVWNLILSKRDLGLYAKGIKPHRSWKISDVKWYFGFKGNPEKCLEQLNKYCKNVNQLYNTNISIPEGI